MKYRLPKYLAFCEKSTEVPYYCVYGRNTIYKAQPESRQEQVMICIYYIISRKIIKKIVIEIIVTTSDVSVKITNKMQPGNRIYYSNVYRRLNMFRTAHRSSSGALTVFAASGLYTHVVTGRSQVWVGTEFPLRLDYGRSPHTYVNQRLQIQLELLMMSGMPLETCWAFNERWINKFYYKFASWWLFLLSIDGMLEVSVFNCNQILLQFCIMMVISTEYRWDVRSFCV